VVNNNNSKIIRTESTIIRETLKENMETLGSYNNDSSIIGGKTASPGSQNHQFEGQLSKNKKKKLFP
jgi:hypothetical protein